MRKTNLKKTGIAAGALCLMLTVGGVMAYFTDKDEKVNAFTVGEIEIDLREDAWDQKPDTDQDGVPDEAESLVPGKRLTKDPKVENTGVNDAYIFVTVEVPCRELVTVNPDGTKNPLEMTELFSYESGPSWNLLGDCMVTEEGKTSRKHLYAYADEDGNCLTVKPQETTLPLFEEVTLVNLMEGQGLEEQPFDILLSAYGIQAENLPDGTKNAEKIWEMITNQKELPEDYTVGKE